MGLFDMFKKVTFDEAVNMVLTNTVPEDEKGFNDTIYTCATLIINIAPRWPVS